MIEFRHDNRFIAPGVDVYQRIIPASGTNWWEPGGTFTCVAAYQAKGAASLAASYVNLANPGTYDAAPGVAPTFDAATGWTFSGTNYLDTGLILSPNDIAGVVRFSDFPGGVFQKTLFGFASQGAFLVELNSSNVICYNGGWAWPTDTATNAGYMANGVYGISNTACYRNGIVEPNSIFDIDKSNNLSIWIGGVNCSGTNKEYFTGKIQAVAFYSTTLDATQVATLTDNMNAL